MPPRKRKQKSSSADENETIDLTSGDAAIVPAKKRVVSVKLEKDDARQDPEAVLTTSATKKPRRSSRLTPAKSARAPAPATSPGQMIRPDQPALVSIPETSSIAGPLEVEGTVQGLEAAGAALVTAAAAQVIAVGDFSAATSGASTPSGRRRRSRAPSEPETPRRRSARLQRAAVRETLSAAGAALQRQQAAAAAPAPAPAAVLTGAALAAAAAAAATGRGPPAAAAAGGAAGVGFLAQVDRPARKSLEAGPPALDRLASEPRLAAGREGKGRRTAPRSPARHPHRDWNLAPVGGGGGGYPGLGTDGYFSEEEQEENGDDGAEETKKCPSKHIQDADGAGRADDVVVAEFRNKATATTSGSRASHHWYARHKKIRESYSAYPKGVDPAVLATAPGLLERTFQWPRAALEKFRERREAWAKARASQKALRAEGQAEKKKATTTKKRVLSNWKGRLATRLELASPLDEGPLWAHLLLWPLLLLSALCLLLARPAALAAWAPGVLGRELAAARGGGGLLPRGGPRRWVRQEANAIMQDLPDFSTLLKEANFRQGGPSSALDQLSAQATLLEQQVVAFRARAEAFAAGGGGGGGPVWGLRRAGAALGEAGRAAALGAAAGEMVAAAAAEVETVLAKVDIAVAARGKGSDEGKQGLEELLDSYQTSAGEYWSRAKQADARLAAAAARLAGAAPGGAAGAAAAARRLAARLPGSWPAGGAGPPDNGGGAAAWLGGAAAAAAAEAGGGGGGGVTRREARALATEHFEAAFASTRVSPTAPNLAARSLGASVLLDLTSEGLGASAPAWKRLAGRMGLAVADFGLSDSPDVMLSSRDIFDECWAFEGGAGRATVALARPAARLAAVALAFAPPALLAPRARRAAAPRRFRVTGYEAGSSPGVPGQAHHLGEWEYQLDARAPALQVFQVADSALQAFGWAPLAFLKLEVLSNHGGEHTCVHRFRAYGWPVVAATTQQ